MKDILLVAYGLLTIVGAAVYIRDIIKGDARPNIVSWITWTLLTFVATVAELSAHEYRTAIFTTTAAAGTLAVVLLGLKYGYVKYTALDVACQLGALVGFLLWWLFNSPAVAVLASVTIDFIGAIPTFRHAWVMPNEETWITYVLCSFGGLLAVFALHSFNITSLAYPSYIVLVNMSISAIIVGRAMVLVKRVQ